ncbi:ParB N-terminal domain-containing protein [Loktanella sp. TSTF-M6]|uniref:ParB N-terminal domain-containing protein n=1 Tax=Loktanella gaetbuli TaxID=2881335 RepID=A0ABS8BTI5_9RHOB|nr:ParB N-terminal domain-containing protein [Loktanella gaetbuli]MCB5199038.1 ParB N-terminal domain-containing protein [Loktanella gaetbuli]
MTFRDIDIGDRPKLRAQPGPRPGLKFILIDQLVIDGDFQRPLNRSNWLAIERIAKAFNWAHFTPIVAAPVGDDRYSVIDGQHRTHAARMIGADSVPAMIVNLTDAEQAAAFTAINGQVTAITAFHIYKAGLAAGEPWAVTARAVVADAGCELMTYHPSAAHKKGRQVYCISLIRSHVEAKRGALVTTGLSALARCASADNPAIWAHGFLRPWLAALQDNPRALQRDLTEFLALQDPLRIQKRVAQMGRKEDYADISHPVLMKRVIDQLLKAWMSGGLPA